MNEIVELLDQDCARTVWQKMKSPSGKARK